MADTNGTLLWKDAALDGAPLLILTSERASNEYLAYLDEKGISWIACGKDKIDLARACEILAAEFGADAPKRFVLRRRRGLASLQTRVKHAAPPYRG